MMKTSDVYLNLVNLQSKNSLLGDSHDGTGNGQNKAKESEINVQRHQSNLVVLPHARHKESHETGHILQAKDNDSGEAKPRVQRVQIWNWRIGQIMRIKDCLQCNHRQYEGGQMDAGVGEFQCLLARGAKTAIHQYGYKQI